MPLIVVLFSALYLLVRIFDRKGSRAALSSLEGDKHTKRVIREVTYNEHDYRPGYGNGHSRTHNTRGGFDIDLAAGIWEDFGN